MAKTIKWSEVRRAFDPAGEARIMQLKEQARAEMGLRELRRRRALSQTTLANRLEVSQSAVSQVERSADVRVSTLRDYVAGLGGELHITAVFDDGVSYAITVGDLGER